MNSQDTLENILYNLSRASNGRSEKLYEFFGVSPDEYEGIFPLTNLQRDIYMDSLISGRPHNYAVAELLEVRESVDPERWKQATDLVVANEQVLRAKLLVRGQIVFQAFSKKPAAPVLFVETTPDNVDEIVRNMSISTCAGFPDQLLHGYAVLKLAEDHFVLAMYGHQLISDAMSSRTFFERAWTIYKQLSAGMVYTAEKVPLYSDYIFYNKDNFDTPETLDFWRKKLCAASWCSNIPLPEKRSATYRTVLRKISGEAFSAVKRYCAANSLTAAQYFKAVFGLALYHTFKPEGDFLLFENQLGRRRHELKCIGTFFNPVPVLLNKQYFGKDVTAGQYFSFYRDFTQEAAPYKLVSFQQINGMVNGRGLKFFYNYVNLSKKSAALPAGSLKVLENSGPEELHLVVEEGTTSFDFKLLYFQEEFMDTHFLDRFIHLSGQLVSGGEITPALPHEQEMIAGFVHSDVNFPVTDTFTDRLTAIVDRFPDEVAVDFEGLQLTYRELDTQSNKLANMLLQQYGINKGDLVGVWMERSQYTVIALLAILKAGAVYLPLDTNNPDERIKYILQHAKPAALVISSRMIRKLSGIEKNVVVIDMQLKKPDLSVTAPAVNITPADNAYVIYTSGSTGHPKGAVIHHGGMLNHLLEKQRILQLDNKAVVAQNANISFDISVWQMLAPLLSGGKLIIFPEEVITDIRAFVELLEGEQVSVLEVVPSYLALLLREGKLESAFAHLQYMLVTGEALTPPLVNAWFKRFPRIRLVNCYGPTEAADDITHFIMDAVPDGPVIPIGRPVANTAVYIVDEDMHLCPPGVKGEILVAGICVGNGYLHDIEKTRQAFLEDPFTTGKRRLYRTGDTGAWAENGNILFYGRKDDQVKINGNRIELAEVEKALLSCPGVENAVVLDLTNDAGDKYLAAYVLPGVPEVQLLRKHLEKLLPLYMIPRAYEMMSEFPLTANGKVDRDALRAMPPSYRNENILLPRNEIERQVSAIWEEVLGRQEIDIREDFFEIGGHSLKAMQVVIRINEQFDLRLDIKLMFMNSTIEQLAEAIAARSILNEQVMDENAEGVTI